MEDFEFYMKRAIELARVSASEGEIPVGAIIVKEGKIIGEGRNRREKEKNALCHAEIEAIDRACKEEGAWRLSGCDLYVTLEPCPMCAGAAVNARIERVIFGAFDEKAGAFGSVVDFNKLQLNHKPKIVCGVCSEECAGMLSSFFEGLRKEKE